MVIWKQRKFKITILLSVLLGIFWISAARAQSTTAGYALRFFGNGVNDIDRVKIQVDNPLTAMPGPPIDVGARDFTVELWLRGALTENTAPAVQCGANINWIYGNIVIDRDRYNQDRKFGLSIADGRLVFGVSGNGTGDHTICGTTNVLDMQWHHVAIQRRRSDGWMWLYVDGELEAQANGPDGNISYPDNGVPGNFCGGPCINSDPYLIIGAEKHDAGPQYPSFSGWIDELRVSNVLRYDGDFVRPSTAFVPDSDTVALYHFDEGAGDVVADSSGFPGGPSHGALRFGGSPAGPEWVLSDAPITGSAPDSESPSRPNNLMATGSIGSVSLRWNASSDDRKVVGYSIYRSRSKGFVPNSSNLIAHAPTTNFIDSGLASGIYFYVVIARDAAGNVSAPSNEASATVTNRPIPITVNFDNPTPGGSSFSLLQGVFQGIDFGTGDWRWEGPYAADPTNHIFFASSTGTSRSFTFAPAPRILDSFRVFTLAAGTLTLSDNVRQTLTRSVSVGSMQLITTGWTQPSTTVTMSFTAGWNLGLDDITHSTPN